MSMIEDQSFFAKLDKADDLLKQGQYGEALAVLENIFTRYPEEEPVLLRLAWASWDSGDKERSVAYWEMLLDRELQRKIFTGPSAGTGQCPPSGRQSDGCLPHL